MGAEVVASDFASEMIENADQYDTHYAARIAYHTLDATDEAALLGLGEGQFTGAICNMALMDMAAIDPLLRALARLLQPAGRFIFSITHPCFNQAAGCVMDALEERAFAPTNQPGRNPLGWNGNFSEIPPVLIVRMRLPK